MERGMTMKHLFIINGLARAEKKKRKAFDRLMAGIDRLQGDVEVQFTAPPDWGAEQIARDCAQRGSRRVSTPAAGTGPSTRWSTARRAMTMWR